MKLYKPLFVVSALCFPMFVTAQPKELGKEIDNGQSIKLQQEFLEGPLTDGLTIPYQPKLDQNPLAMTFIFDKDESALTLEQILAMRRKKYEIPLPGAIGTEVNVIGYEEWKRCSSSGYEVLDKECDLYDAEKCIDLKLKFRDSCFSPASSLSQNNGIQPSIDTRTGVDISQAKTLLGVLRIGGRITCSGTFLTKNHFLTAGHCNSAIRACHSPDCSAKIESDLSGSAVRTPKRLVSPEYDKGELASDFSIWELDALGQDAAWEGNLVKVADSRAGLGNAGIFRQKALIIGAPGFPCSPNSPDCSGGQIFWLPSPFTNCAVTCSDGNGLLFHDCQSFPGMSGAPVFTGKTGSGRIRLAGIHNGYFEQAIPPACSADTHAMVSMTHICKWINTDSNVPELKEICDGNN